MDVVTLLVSLVLVICTFVYFRLRHITNKEKESCVLKGWKEHCAITAKILSEMKDWKSQPTKNRNRYLTLSRKQTSVTTRKCQYKNECDSINIRQLDSVISIDTDSHTCWVESNCNMYQFVSTVLPWGYIPCVTPEFKNITVGGAVAGLGIESSSFKYGLFHETCVTFEVILPTLKLVKIDASNELFYMIPGSFNSLALITALQVKLIKLRISDNISVHINYETIHMNDIIGDNLKHYDFVEYLRPRNNVDDNAECIACYGVIRKSNSKSNIFAMKYWFHKLYYRFVWDLFEAGALSNYDHFVGIKEYLFRHDRGCFWIYDELANRLSWRLLFGAFMNAKNILSTANMAKKDWNVATTEYVAHSMIVDDYGIPYANLLQFVQEINIRCGVEKELWLCPFRISQKSNKYLFASFGYDQSNAMNNMAMDVGLYFGNHSKRWYSSVQMYRKAELCAIKNNGYKAYYSSSYLNQSEFWSAYDRQKYEQWRQKLKANQMFHNIYQKVAEFGSRYSDLNIQDPEPWGDRQPFYDQHLYFLVWLYRNVRISLQL